MAPVTVTSTEPRVVKLLITGFGTFKGHTATNPSSLAARHLHNITLTSPPSSPFGTTPSKSDPDEPAVSTPSVRIEITFLGPLDVTYTSVRSTIVSLHQSHAYDAYVHVGVGAADPKGRIFIERRGRRLGYEKLDAQGELCEIIKTEGARGGRGVRDWAGGEGQEEELQTPIDVERLVEDLHGLGFKYCDVSSDAGLYLCEYILATSLNAALSAASQASDSDRPSTAAPVAFIHVPMLRPDSAEETSLLHYTERDVASALKYVCWVVGNSVVA